MKNSRGSTRPQTGLELMLYIAYSREDKKLICGALVSVLLLPPVDYPQPCLDPCFSTELSFGK